MWHIMKSGELNVKDSKVAIHALKQSAGGGAVDDSTTRECFRRLQFRDTKTEDKPRLGHASTTTDKALHQDVKDNPRTSAQRMTASLGPSQSDYFAEKLTCIFFVDH